MSLIFATQLAAVATAVLAVGAIVTGVLAYLAFRKQSQEVGILQRQVQEESHRRRSQQASRVIFSDMPTVTDSDKGRTFRFQTEITNHSDLPIYDVTLLWDVEKLSELRGVEHALGTAPTLLRQDSTMAGRLTHQAMQPDGYACRLGQLDCSSGARTGAPQERGQPSAPSPIIAAYRSCPAARP